MPYLSRENLYRPTTTPEQMNFLENFYNAFDSGGVHKKILNVEPLTYMGAIAGTEFLTYSVNKLYLNFASVFSTGAYLITAEPYVQLLDESNAISGYIKVNDPDKIFINNCYFSRFTVSIYDYIIFNGYRITLN